MIRKRLKLCLRDNGIRDLRVVSSWKQNFERRGCYGLKREEHQFSLKHWKEYKVMRERDLIWVYSMIG